MPLALLALLFVQLNFGLLPIAQKTILSHLTPWSLFAVRTLAAALVFDFAYRIWAWSRRRSGVSGYVSGVRIGPLLYLWLSFLGIAANQLLLILALNFGKAVAAVIMVPAITLLTYAFAVLLGKEVFTWPRALTLMMGGAGVLVLFADSIYGLLQGWGAEALAGNILCLVSAAVYALYLVQSRDWVRQLPPLQFTSHLFRYALIWVVAFLGIAYLTSQPSQQAEFFMRAQARPLPGLGTVPSLGTVEAMLLFVVIGPTILNYFFNLLVLRTLPASTVSGFISLQTLIGAAAAKFYLNEEMKASYGLAAVFILGSVVLLSWQSFGKRQSQKTNSSNLGADKSMA